MKLQKKGTRISLLLLCFCLFFLSACQREKAMKAGTYEGQGQGYSDKTPVRLSVSIDEKGEIYQVNILEQDETPDIGGKALDELVEEVEKKQSSEPDIISGATRTSEAFRQALAQAINQARQKDQAGSAEK